jgi:putative endonuclease
MARHNDTGTWGEQKAVEYLQNKGYEIVVKNYRHLQAEIDLIARKGKLLIFVEVKTRTGTGYGLPEEFVSYTKSKLVMKAAEGYIFDTNWQFDVRFDIISILIFPDGGLNIRHLEDAFY